MTLTKQLEANLNTLKAAAIARIEGSAHGLAEIVTECQNTDEQAIADFVMKCLEWYNDKIRATYLYDIAQPSFWANELDFLGSLCSFVSHEIMDDGCFVVKWAKPDYKITMQEFDGRAFPRREVQWEGGTYKKVYTTQDDPETMPEIHRGSDTDPNASQNAALLIEVMDIYEQRTLARNAKTEQVLANIRRLRS